MSSQTVVDVSPFTIARFITVATSATNLSVLPSAVRLRHVTAWTPIINTFVPQLQVIEWGSAGASVGGLSVRHSDTSMGVTPAYLSLAPPKASFADMWQVGTTTTPLFSFEGQDGSTIDIDFEYRLNDSATVVNQVVAGATAGVLYVSTPDELHADNTQQIHY